MSELGWKAFLDAKLEDWVVLHGGAMAYYRVHDFAKATALASSIAAIPRLAGKGAVMTAAERSLSVRLTRDIWQLDQDHIALAQSISKVARDHQATSDRSCVQEVQIAIAAKREDVNLGFWQAALGYAPLADDNAADPLGHSSTVWMQELSDSKKLRHAMHIDVSLAREQVETRIAAAVAAGGRIIDDKAPSHWTLADPAGNRVCICAWPDGFGDQTIDQCDSAA